MLQQRRENQVGIPKSGAKCMVVMLKGSTKIATLVKIYRNRTLAMPRPIQQKENNKLNVSSTSPPHKRQRSNNSNITGGTAGTAGNHFDESLNVVNHLPHDNTVLPRQSLAEYWNEKTAIRLYEKERSKSIVQVDLQFTLTGPRYTYPADMVYPLSNKGYMKATEGVSESTVDTAADAAAAYSYPWLSNITVGLRKAFVAEKGYKLLALDYCQVELRIAASLSGNTQFQSIFAKDCPDPFRALAAKLVNTNDVESVTDEQRTIAKSQSYAWLYGSLMKNAGGGSSRTVATVFPGANQYHQVVQEEFDALGGVYTLGGNFRQCDTFPVALNAKSQGTAADVFKHVLGTLHRRLCVELPKVRIILIVHDEIILEVPNTLVLQARNMVATEMENGGTYFGLSVPLAVTAKVGTTYGQLTKMPT
jgi:hypothetical protein